MKPKLTAQALLLQAAQAGATAWQATFQAIGLLVIEPDMAKQLKGAKADAGRKLSLGAVKQRMITAKAKGYLKDSPNAYDTISGYIRKAASIVLVPNVIAVIETGDGDKASKREVTAATIKTRRDMTALAAAANAKLGIVKQANAGNKKADAVETPEQMAKRKAAEAIEKSLANAKANAKLAADADKGSALTIHALIKKAFDGQHPNMEQAIRDGLHAVGYKLTMIVLDVKHGGKAGAPKGKTTKTAPEVAAPAP